MTAPSSARGSSKTKTVSMLLGYALPYLITLSLPLLSQQYAHTFPPTVSLGSGNWTSHHAGDAARQALLRFASAGEFGRLSFSVSSRVLLCPVVRSPSQHHSRWSTYPLRLPPLPPLPRLRLRLRVKRRAALSGQQGAQHRVIIDSVRGRRSPHELVSMQAAMSRMLKSIIYVFKPK